MAAGGPSSLAVAGSSARRAAARARRRARPMVAAWETTELGCVVLGPREPLGLGTGGAPLGPWELRGLDAGVFFADVGLLVVDTDLYQATHASRDMLSVLGSAIEHPAKGGEMGNRRGSRVVRPWHAVQLGMSGAQWWGGWRDTPPPRQS